MQTIIWNIMHDRNPVMPSNVAKAEMLSATEEITVTKEINTTS